MQYAHFDPSSRQVIGWIDTEAFHYESLPPEGQLLVLTEEQYELRDQPRWVSAKGVLLDAAPIAEISLVALKEQKSAEITEACAKAITAGFVCDVLGKAYLYPSNTEDQLNLTGTVAASQLPQNAKNPDWRGPFTCLDPDTGVWGDQMHTAEQIQKVAGVSYDTILSLRIKRKGLLAKIAAYEDAASVRGVVWS
ncbi:DUF4376 domain-containing protein [Pseudomonas oryzihabitans]|uniref:DUF4376 domain-containing protein n=1 Tax=Pseudomonas oryzihabitans TaxID=47885 RepID=UPI0028AC704F|nr:hypothetical protein [Pseudomonas oryzihabitans]